MSSRDELLSKILVHSSVVPVIVLCRIPSPVSSSPKFVVVPLSDEKRDREADCEIGKHLVPTYFFTCLPYCTKFTYYGEENLWYIKKIRYRKFKFGF